MTPKRRDFRPGTEVITQGFVGAQSALNERRAIVVRRNLLGGLTLVVDLPQGLRKRSYFLYENVRLP